MIQSLEISNFKCFKAVELHDLRRFNVIVGQSGGGKTAFLEALFLLIGDGPELARKVRGLRPAACGSTPSSPGSSSESPWQNLFFNFDETRAIELNAVGSDEISRSLIVFSDNLDEVALPSGRPSVGDSVRRRTVTFRYRTSDGCELNRRPTLTNEGWSLGPAVTSLPAVFLPPGMREDPEQNGQRFSSLSERGEHQAIVSVIRTLFPFIEELGVEHDGDAATVHAKLRSVSATMPLPLVSDGVDMLLSILLAVHHSRGMILVDEMERSLHFDLMEPSSAAILAAARKSNSQVFVTTHSIEYLRALLPTIQEHPDDFRLLRAASGDVGSEIHCFDGEHVAAALDEGLEVR